MNDTDVDNILGDFLDSHIEGWEVIEGVRNRAKAKLDAHYASVYEKKLIEARIDELHRQLENSEYAEDRTATEIRDRIEATINQLKASNKEEE